jgi:hypothetical protein
LFDQGILDLQTGSFADVPVTGVICLEHGQDT